MWSLRGVIVALVAALLAPSQASARTGLVDRDFGRRGLVRTDLGKGADAATAVAVQPDGRIVVAGYAQGAEGSDVALVRHRADGTLDGSFGDAGKVLADFAGEDEASALAISPDGGIVVVGSTTRPDGLRALLIARFTAKGALDPGFGDAGRIVLDLGRAAARGRAVVVLADGAVVVAGAVGMGARQRFLLARLDPAGRLDPRFGDGGVSRVSFHQGAGAAFALGLQGDGRLVVSGRVAGDFAVARYEANGDLDADFGDDGVTLIDVDGGHDVARALALQPDRRILVAGTSVRSGESDFAIARLEPSGGIDDDFGSAGVRRTDVGGLESGHGLVLQPDGTIVVAGQSATDEDSDLALVAYLPSGAPDPGFGRGGRVRTDLQSTADGALAVALQPDGRIVAAGVRGEGASAEMALVRYRPGAPECGDGFVEGMEVCDLGDANGTSASCCTAACAYRGQAETCRRAEGLCDAVETCSGSAATCPADEIRSAQFACRKEAGWCDLPESCSGASKQCPADRVRGREATCRPAIGPCDAAETCDGESPACPSDAKSIDVCRPADGDCDLPERCDGVRDDCPRDLLQPNGNTCYDRNPCTVDEICLEGECGEGTFEPFMCGALVCRRWSASTVGEVVVEDRTPRLEDGIEPGVFRLKSPTKTFFCSRASLTGEAWVEDGEEVVVDPSAGAVADRYRLSVPLESPTLTLEGLIISDRFGRHSVSVSSLRRLSLPVTTGGAAAAEALSPDQRKCYGVEGARSVRVGGLPMWVGEDPLQFDVKKLKQVCVPVAVNGVASVSDVAVACYAARRSRGELPPTSGGQADVRSQDGNRWRLTNADEEYLCVPAVVELPVRRLAPSPIDESVDAPRTG